MEKEKLLDWINKEKKNNLFAEKVVEYLKLNVVDMKDEYSSIELKENVLIILAGKSGEIRANEALIRLLSED